MSRCTVGLLAFVAVFGSVSYTSGQVPAAQAPASPMILALSNKLQTGDADATAAFWDSVRAHGTPLVEPAAGDGNSVLVTFLYRGTSDTKRVAITGSVLVMQVFASEAPDNLVLTRLGSSDVWYRTLTMRREARFEYQFAVATSAQPEVAGPRRGQPDPLNPRRYNDTSAVALPGAPAQPYVEARAGVPRGHVERRRIASGILNNERDLEIYTPPGYTTAGQKYPLLIHFDLDQYGDGKVIPTPTILNNLIAEHRIVPVVAVLVGNTKRNLELPCNSDFAKFLHEELLPMARKEFHVSTRAADTVVGGSSFGGLASGCAALRYPEDFGNVLSQAGSYYWEPTTLPATVVNGRRQRDIYAESNWVAQQIVERPKLPIRFFLDAGLYDTDPTDRGVNILESNRRLKDVLRAKGYVVKYEEFFGSHDPLCWRGTLADGLMFLLGTRNTNVR